MNETFFDEAPPQISIEKRLEEAYNTIAIQRRELNTLKGKIFEIFFLISGEFPDECVGISIEEAFNEICLRLKK